MKKQNLHYLLTILLLTIFISCNEEDFSLDSSEAEVSDDSIKVLNGRLYFKDKITFQNFHKEMKEKDDNEVANILDKKFYSKGFYSLAPVVNEKTETKQFERHFSKIQEKSFNKSRGVDKNSFIDHFDDLEEVFGEALFGSFLNQDAEIRVADTIYQYTDHGLLMVEHNQYQKLIDFKNEKNDIHSLGDINNVMNKNHCEIALYMGNRDGGYNNITVEIRHYMSRLFYPIDDHDPCNIGGGIGGIGDGNNPNPDPAPPVNAINETYTEIAEISTTLDACSGSEPWLPNLFGTVKVCTDRYESKRRVKTKYWDVDFGLGFSIGVKVKHQKRGWTGIWRNERTDKVALGINSISWEFDIPSPVFPPTHNLARVYTDGLAWETIFNDSQANMYPLGIVDVPQFPLNTDLDAIVEFATNLPIDGGLTSEYKIRKKFYDLLFDKVKDLLNNERNKELRKLGLIVRTQTHAYIQYYDFTKYCSNCKRQRKVFDWGVMSPTVTYNFGTGSVGFNNLLSDLQFDFQQPRSTGANIFGMAKRNGIWHGSRMVFEEEN